MTFAEYYRGRFRQDLAAILAGTPEVHEHPGDPPGGTLQLRSLSAENRAIRGLRRESAVLFATALYFTVLVDEVMYTYFQPHYDAFESLARYPKLRGDCPSACYSHIHPSHLFGTMCRAMGNVQEDELAPFRGTIQDAIPVMRGEVLDFFLMHMKKVNGSEVWRRCCREAPLSGMVPLDAA